MKNQIAEELIQKYLDGKCSPEEKALLYSWYNHRSHTLKDDFEEPDYAALHGKISSGLPPATKRHKLWPGIAAAASILLGVTAAVLFYNRPKTSVETVSVYSHDLAPGGDAATLTLSNGAKIALTDLKKGDRIVRAGIEVYKNSEGQLVYKTIDEGATGQNAEQYNTIETPKGGQYQLVLPDGTVVFLNAASVLRFPAVFAKEGRKVELIGEAFFDVAKVKRDKGSVPFTVSAGKTKIEVLGTQFNVAAYLNESGQETTLVEGVVRVSRIADKNEAEGLHQPRVLKPGEQARISNTAAGIEVVKDLNTDAILGWKSGVFLFDSTPINKVMQQISRWYDAKIEYVGTIPNVAFNGVIPRSSYASEVLKVLEMAGPLRFSIEDKKIKVQVKNKK